MVVEETPAKKFDCMNIDQRGVRGAGRLLIPSWIFLTSVFHFFAHPDVSEVVRAHTDTQSAVRPHRARDKACLVYDHSLFFP